MRVLLRLACGPDTRLEQVIDPFLWIRGPNTCLGSAWRQWTAAALVCLFSLPPVWYSRPCLFQWAADKEMCTPRPSEAELRVHTAPHCNYTEALCNFRNKGISEQLCARSGTGREPDGTQQPPWTGRRRDSHYISTLIPKRLQQQCWLTELERKCAFWLSCALGGEWAANRPTATSSSSTWSSANCD